MDSTKPNVTSVASAGSDSALSPASAIPANMLRRHPASLIPRYLHDPVLLSLLKAPLNDELIAYVAERTLAVVATPSEPTQLPTPPTTPIKSTFRRSFSRKGRDASDAASSETACYETSNDSSKAGVPSLVTFIKLTSARSNAQAPTLLMTLVYLDRLRQRLKGAKAAKGMQCTYHRLFLACLIAAAKYCNDCCPRNVHWVKWSGLFTLSEVNLMEQELLMLLDHELRVEEKDLILICAPFLPASSLERANNMDRNMPSLSSCSTSRTSSATSSGDLDTPESSPISTIRSDMPPPPALVPAIERKKFKIVETASTTATVITRAKSWYGNLRGVGSLPT